MSYETTQTSLMGGTASVGSSALTLSAHVGTNAELFPDILSLHVEEGSTVADVTYGKGVFWNHVPEGVYDVHGTDIDPEKSPTGEPVDCRDLPYADGSIDCVVFDPPYASGYYRKNGERPSKSDFRDRYGLPDGVDKGELPKYHGAVRTIYYQAGVEARRVLTDDGTFIVKCQDEVVNHQNWFTHVEIMQDYEEIGFEAKDLFVLVRRDTPTNVGCDNQEHARKNHSYFLVFEVDE